MSFSNFNPFRKPQPSQVVASQLHSAELALLEAQAAKEHYDHEVLKLQCRISRLKELQRIEFNNDCPQIKMAFAK